MASPGCSKALPRWPEGQAGPPRGDTCCNHCGDITAPTGHTDTGAGQPHYTRMVSHQDVIGVGSRDREGWTTGQISHMVPSLTPRFSLCSD